MGQRLQKSAILVIFTGSVDSDPGNQTGRGILSYLSICSENTKKEFLDKLMKDKEKYSLEKDNIEKMYTGQFLIQNDEVVICLRNLQ